MLGTLLQDLIRELESFFILLVLVLDLEKGRCVSRKGHPARQLSERLTRSSLKRRCSLGASVPDAAFGGIVSWRAYVGTLCPSRKRSKSSCESSEMSADRRRSGEYPSLLALTVCYSLFRSPASEAAAGSRISNTCPCVGPVPVSVAWSIDAFVARHVHHFTRSWRRARRESLRPRPSILTQKTPTPTGCTFARTSWAVRLRSS
jgi:hypothetical protein